MLASFGENTSCGLQVTYKYTSYPLEKSIITWQ